LTPQQQPRHVDSSLEHLDGGLDISTAALTPQQHFDGGLGTSSAALTPRQQKHLKVED
jgi:hypothetical protein